ncbi:MAG: substrate-binding domain-containing protein [Firmicutes bacterium]|nr:substrate-binding domain-containing protein [Bacillota bacterium]
MTVTAQPFPPADLFLRTLVSLGGLTRAERLCSLLAAIGEKGSISAAASGMGLSYRHAWGLIGEAENALARALLERKVGGPGGGGAALTPAAGELLEHHRSFRRAGAVEGARAGIEKAAAAGIEKPEGAAVGTGTGNSAGSLAGTGAPPGPGGAVKLPLLIAGTIGPIETGLLGALEAAYHARRSGLVRHIAAGSGQALDLARAGRVDLVLAHAPLQEEAFVREGFGTGRHPLMRNDFMVVGPRSDPARSAGAGGAADALRRIAAAPAPFVSRGDRSGTHLKESALWEAAGVEANFPGYQVYEGGALGSAATLRHAAAAGAYTLVDRATFTIFTKEWRDRTPGEAAGSPGLTVLFEGDPVLDNLFSLIPVARGSFPGAEPSKALDFVVWATGPEGQELIAEFGRVTYGRPLFTPVGPSAPSAPSAPSTPAAGR